MFLDAVGKKLKKQGIGLSTLKQHIKDAKLSNADVEKIYRESTGNQASYSKIIESMDLAKSVLQEIAMNNW